MKKENENTSKKNIKQSLIISGVLVYLVTNIVLLYFSMDRPIERIAVAILGFCLIVPTIPIILMFTLNLVATSNRQSITDTKNNYKTSNVKIPKPSSKPITEANKPKLKVVNTEGYQEFNNILKASVQNKLMTRQCILQLKSELIYRIGTHIEVYKNFQFKNDMHEIYTLSKSSVLTKADYQYLTEFISNNLILPKEA